MIDFKKYDPFKKEDKKTIKYAPSYHKKDLIKFYTEYLKKNHINYEVPTEKYTYIDNGQSVEYSCDFHLIDTNEYIILKGCIVPQDKKLLTLSGKNIKILELKDLFELGLQSLNK